MSILEFKSKEHKHLVGTFLITKEEDPKLLLLKRNADSHLPYYTLITY